MSNNDNNKNEELKDGDELSDEDLYLFIQNYRKRDYGKFNVTASEPFEKTVLMYSLYSSDIACILFILMY
jgi:hypothetical protein